MSDSLRDEAPLSFPRVLLPPADGVSPGFLFGVKYALDAVERMQTIPEALIPCYGLSYAPPKFNFGWSIEDHDEIIVALEATHPELIVQVPDHIGLEATLERVHQYMVHELQLSAEWRPRFEYTESRDSSVPGSTIRGVDCFTVTNTYVNGACQPPEEVIQAMKEIFRLKGQPKWFLDFHHGRWQERWIFEDGGIEVMT
ncbi:hypothetical protein CPB85DRAFT_1254961 [Mucidula mucida]|nr:hypothetical protein CPB85DRAFT_1254961 [Mucidula mucida]